jgi:4-carboxymuconolactone decarboxylase
MARMPDPREGLDAEGQAIYDKLAGPRGGLSGVYQALMHHPALAEHVGQLGGFLRFGGTLPGDVRELAIMATARGLGTPFMWEKHVEPARKANLPDEVVEAVRTGDPETADVTPLYRAVWRAARHVTAQEEIPAELQDELVDALGTREMVELVAICGFYRFIATIAVSFDAELPEPGPAPF